MVIIPALVGTSQEAPTSKRELRWWEYVTAEYIADIQPDQCIGCRNCQKLCQFGAIEYSANNRKCYIISTKCYGCGVCRNACQKEAIALLDKNKIPELAEVW